MSDKPASRLAVGFAAVLLTCIAAIVVALTIKLVLVIV